MLAKVWEVAILVIVVALAARLVTAAVQPVLPVVLTGAICITLLGTLYHHKRKWWVMSNNVDFQFTDAIVQLDDYVNFKAQEAAAQLGFSWEAQTDAPSTYESLVEAFHQSRADHAPLPVSSLFCEAIIYRDEASNHAMRFWHDTLHVRTGLSFRLDDELELGLYHLKIAERDGIRKHSLGWRMLRVDLLGQNYLLGIAKRFPIDQREFVAGCLQHGLDEGILREARKTLV